MGKADMAMEDLEKKPAEEILAYAAKNYSGRIALASSFGAEDVVLVDMLAGINPQAEIFFLDTGRLNEETYEVIERIRLKYPVKIKAYFPQADLVEKLETAEGAYSFRKSREKRMECCRIRKVEPLSRALAGRDAWITGLRREQDPGRKDIKKMEIDAAHGGIYKFNPLADWSEKMVWKRIKERNIPYNRLHDDNYPSIGCAPCTRAIKPGEDLRAGRWWWDNGERKECGLHLAR
jgi:phosphoadenosine phosphosulfate reductase